MPDLIAQKIEHTNLKPTAGYKDFELLVDQAVQNSMYGICVPPFWVRKVWRDIQKTPLKLVTVAGFPFGYQMTEAKIEEIKKAIDNGADEIDVVMNISAFKAKMEWAKIELAKCAKACHDQEKLVKVIIETAYLTNDEIISACQIAVKAGADFVKTSTGYAATGATVEAVKLMRESIPDTVEIKASGGIKTWAQAKALIEAGATRIGTSSAVEIIKESKN